MIARAALSVALAIVLASHAVGAEEDGVRSTLSSAKAPWYDAKADSWRRIEPPERPPAKPEAEPDSAPHGVRVPQDGIPIFAYLMCAIAVGVLLWLATMLVRGRRALYQEQREIHAAPLPRVDISALAFAPAVGRGDPEAALAAAVRAGDWRTAAIWIYALMLMRLDRVGIIRIEPGKTNRAYRREAGTAPERAVGALDAGIDVFERTYFGHLAVDRETISQLIEQRAALESALAAQAEP